MKVIHVDLCGSTAAEATGMRNKCRIKKWSTWGQVKYIVSDEKMRYMQRIHEAAMFGEVELLKKLIARGSDVNDIRDWDHHTPLHWAVYHGHKDAAEVLLAAGADPDIADGSGERPLHWAACQNNHEIADMLIKRGARVDILIAAGLGMEDQVKSFLEDDHRLIDASNYFGKTALHVAALCGHAQIISYLIEQGADVNRVSSSGTPLHMAAEHGHGNIVRILLDRGADPNSVISDDTLHMEGITPLHEAAEAGALDVVHILVNAGARLEASAKHRGTPLHMAARSGNAEAVKLLLELGAQVDAFDKYQRTPLYKAAEGGHLEIIKMLVANGADVKIGHGAPYCTPLAAAIREGYLRIAEYLLDKGAQTTLGYKLKYYMKKLCGLFRSR